MSIFLSLGTNIGDRKINLNKAISLINSESKININSQSKIYETSPMENQNQDFFLNQILEIKTNLKPLKLLKTLKNIENVMGRFQTNKRYMPRIIDIDILSYDDIVFNNDNLSIPHNKIKFRKFILKPWTDIAPDYILPNSKSTIKELLAQIYDSKDIVKEY